MRERERERERVVGRVGGRGRAATKLRNYPLPSLLWFPPVTAAIAARKIYVHAFARVRECPYKKGGNDTAAPVYVPIRIYLRIYVYAYI
jgi:hypothetical protein